MIMNWTEGKLARHSRARPGKQSKQTLLRQKEHFAKARAGLLPNSSRHPPPSPHFSRPAVPLQVENTAWPGARTSDKISDRPRKRGWSSSLGDHGVLYQHLGAKPYGNSIKQPGNVNGMSLGVVEDAAILEKKRKLLRESDWAGIGMQKPIPVTFEQSQPGNSRWTRRRKSSASRSRQLTGGGYDQSRNVNDSAGQSRKYQDVRITVGSQEVRLGEGSSIGQPRRAPMSSQASLPSCVPVASEAGHPRLVPMSSEPVRHRLVPISSEPALPGRVPVASEAPQPFRGVAMPSTFHASTASLAQSYHGLSMENRPPPRLNAYQLSETARSQQAQGDSFAPPVLRAPKPIRPLPRIKSSFESIARESTDSLAGQVDQVESSIPASQQEDNEAWRTFAGPSQSRAHDETSSVAEPLRPQVIPGISVRSQESISSAALPSEPGPYSNSSGTSGYQHMASDDLSCMDSQGDQTIVLPLGPTVSQPVPVASSGSQQVSSGETFPSRTESQEGFGDSSPKYGSDSGDVPLFPSDERDLRSQSTHSDGWETFESEDSDTDSIDQRVASLREAALKLISHENAEPGFRLANEASYGTISHGPGKPSPDSLRRSTDQEQEVTDHTVGNHWPSENTRGVELGSKIGLGMLGEDLTYHDRGGSEVGAVVSDSLATEAHIPPGQTSTQSSPGGFSPIDSLPTKDASRTESPGRASCRGESPRTESPKTKSPKNDGEDIWFKYVFSDTNTEDLHKEVLDEAAKEAARNLPERADLDDTDRALASEVECNISTAATHGHASIGETESEVDEDLTSSYGVSASHNAAIGSPVTSAQIAGSAFDEWEGLGGPPYAAPSLQGLASPGTIASLQQDMSDSGPSTQATSQAVTLPTSSISSKAVEPPQSVADGNATKESPRFAPPRVFRGKLSGSTPSVHVNTAVKPVTMTKPKRGRSKKRARDGRPDIRSIPLFDDDPIEDFDDQGNGHSKIRKKGQGRVEPSLFPALQME